MLKKIISGGQTGADRAALDIAIKFNIEYGGWIPRRRKTETGPLSARYQLKEKVLLKNCSFMMKDDKITIEDAVMHILKQLKHDLEPDHVLRVMK